MLTKQAVRPIQRTINDGKWSQMSVLGTILPQQVDIVFIENMMNILNFLGIENERNLLAMKKIQRRESKQKVDVGSQLRIKPPCILGDVGADLNSLGLIELFSVNKVSLV